MNPPRAKVVGRIAVLLLLSIGVASASAADRNLLDQVSTLQGTDSDGSLSHGGTLPLVAPPWPMTQWSPQTYGGTFFEGGGWWFQSKGTHICGFRATRQPSPWMGDYGQFSIMPETGDLVVDNEHRESEYDINASTFKPDYVKIDLKRYNVTTEMTASERCGVFRMTFNDGDIGRLVISPARTSHVEIDGRTIRGYSTANSGGVPKGWKAYFVMHIDRDLSAAGTYDAAGHIAKDAKTIDGDRIGAYIEFATQSSRAVNVSIGTSYISYEQAELNLTKEADGGFDAVRQRTADAWEKNLSRMQVKGGTDEQRHTFYSCLYRAQTFPHKLYELTADGKPTHFSMYDGQIHDGVAYGDIGFWDVYRANFPLWSIVFPDQLSEILGGFVQSYRESGWFPQWPSPGQRNGMIGSHIDAVIADAVAKNIGGFDIPTAYEGIRKNAFDTPANGSVGRGSLKEYETLGYVPTGHDAGYSVSCTLDYAYDDWCIAQVAKTLGKEDDYAKLMARSKNYQKLWDPSVGFFRPKRADGQWFGPFDEFAWSDGFVEGGPWQCTWAVQHDVPGLMKLMGGKEAMGQKLDRLLGLPPIFHVGGYGNVIHEMTEMANARFGQYAQSNQPSHHILYLFAAIGEPEKTQYWTRHVCEELYNSGPDGFAGDEDNGEMSSWYVLSSSGLYQLCVGNPTYTLTSPLFDEIAITLPGDKQFIIRTKDNAPQHVYVQHRTLNGQPFTGDTLSHAKLIEGGTMEVDMGPRPLEGVTP